MSTTTPGGTFADLGLSKPDSDVGKTRKVVLQHDMYVSAMLTPSFLASQSLIAPGSCSNIFFAFSPANAPQRQTTTRCGPTFVARWNFLRTSTTALAMARSRPAPTRASQSRTTVECANWDMARFVVAVAETTGGIDES